MDPRDRADAALARARARGAFVVTPDDAVSPMDAKNTQQIPRIVVLAPKCVRIQSSVAASPSGLYAGSKYGMAMRSGA